MTPKFLGKKKSKNLSLGQILSSDQNFLQHSFFLFVDILLNLEQTDIDMLVEV